MGKQFKKLECVMCGYQFPSAAKEPRCTQCGSRRMNDLKEFTSSKPHKTTKEDEKMKEKETEPAKTEENPDEDDDELSDIDRDIWG